MNENDYIQLLESFSTILVQKGLSVIGCKTNEIELLENRYGKLPRFYKLFLKHFGCKAGDFKVGTWMFYSELEDINHETLKLMFQNNVTPPQAIFSYLMHQGYTSLFFTDRKSDDPKIYCYTECEKIADINKTFSQCLETEINEYLADAK